MKNKFRLPEGIPPEALEEFMVETSENLDLVDTCLNLFDRNRVNPEAIHKIFRSIHTIKGGASYLGLIEIKNISHHLESILDFARSSPYFKVGESFLSLAFQATATIRKLLLILKSPDHSIDIHSLIMNLERYSNIIRIPYNKSKLTQSHDSRPESHDLYSDLTEVTQRSIRDLDEMIKGIQENKVDALSPAYSVDSSIMRIDQKHIDHLMNLVGELIVTKNAIEHLQISLNGTEEERKLALRDFRTHSARLGSVSDQMQQTMRRVRLVPMRTQFQKYPGMLRELERLTGKKVQLILEGDEIEIDKKIADEIAEPIMHLIRNAIDHGIESEEQRLKLGKSNQGVIRLAAYQENGKVIITVSDDGAGVDLNRILSLAIAKGLISAQNEGSLSRQEILDLIFRPGLTTATQVTEISGRGVGLDVVQTKISGIQGKISYQTELGQGTKFRLELPTTMAVLESLLVSSQEQLFAFPLKSILETIRIKKEDLKTIMNQKAITLRDDIIGVEWLSAILGYDEENPSIGISTPTLSILILKSEQEKFGVIVDSIEKNQEIVVKPLPSELTFISSFSGASVLGNGRAIFILDPAKVISTSVSRKVEQNELRKVE